MARRMMVALCAAAIAGAMPAAAGGLFSAPDLIEATKAAGNIDLARDALLRGDDPDVLDDDRKTPLMRAAEHGFTDIARLLLGAPRIRPDLRDGEGKTALFWAADTGHVAIVRLLVEHGVAVDEPAKLGITPLMIAASHGDDEIVEILLKAHADPARTDYTGKDAVGWAEDAHNPAVLAELRARR